jgi:acetylglutamate kinase
LKTKIEKAQIILDALPYIRKYAGKTFIIKYGGSAQINPILKDKFAQDIALFYLVGIKLIIVHGGGNKITSLLDKLNIKSEFKDGLRVTSKESMEIVEMVLSGNINKEITSRLNSHGAKAIGLTGKDANFFKAVPKDNGKYGLVGDIVEIDKKVIYKLLDENFIPVVAPIAATDNAEDIGLNINADLVASKIAGELKAEKVLFLTDTLGVLDESEQLIPTLEKHEIKELIKKGVIKGGMLPKVEACLEAVENGCTKAHIIDGRIEHSLLLEVFTSEGIGTVIKEKGVE